MNLHDSKEILTLSQHHETHYKSEPHIPLALLHHMPYCDIMKPLHRSTPRSPGNYCEFNPNQVSSPKGEGSPKTTKLGNRTTQGCYRIPLFAPACRPARCPQTSSDAGRTFFPAHNFAAQAWLQPTHCGMGLLLYVGAGAFLQLPYRCTSSNLNQHKQHAQFSHNNTTMPNSQSRLGCQDAWMHAGYQYQALGANNFSLTQRHLHTPSRNAHKEYNSGSCMEDARSFMRLIRSAKLILLGFALISGLGV